MVDRKDSTNPLRDSEKIYYPESLRSDSEKPLSGSESTGTSDLEKAPKPDPNQCPDGGLQAWLVVFGCWCCLFCSFGWVSSIGVFQNYYELHQLKDLPTSTTAWISSLQGFFQFAGGPILGKVYDNYGPRYILLVGTFLHVFGLCMASISTEYYQLILSQGVCSAIGAGCIFYPALTAVGPWFQKRRALAYGIIASGSSIGGIILPIMVSHLFPKIGFGWTMRTVAFTILFLMILANLTVKSRIPPNPRPLVIKEFWQPLHEPTFLLCVIATFIFYVAFFCPINYIIVQGRAEGISVSLAAYLVPILNAGSFVGRILPSYVADKIGRFNMIIIMCLFTSIMVLGLWIPATSSGSIIAFAVMYGFGTGAFVSLIAALTVQITKDLSRLGVRNGTMFVFISIAALIGNPIAGALVAAWQGNFAGLQIFCGILQLLGGLVFVAARIVNAGPRLTTIV